jgi:LacI family transcriptional regulator
MAERAKRATIYDVAREAGVAPSTVSNVLSGKPYVSAASKKRVLEAVEKLGFRALPAAQALRARRSLAVGVLIWDVANPSFPDFVRGVEDVVTREGGTMLLCNTDGREDIQICHMRGLMQRGADGVVLISQHVTSPEVRSLMNSGPPFVLVQRRSENHQDDFVGSDNRTGVLSIIRHLRTCGHSRIGFVRGPAESSTAVERLSVFRNAIGEHGLDPDPELIYPGDYSSASGFQAATLMLQRRHPPTAIIASNDLNALGVMEAAHQLGISIPDQLSVVGFDDIQLASLSRIDLTTVHQPKRDMGMAAAELLLRKIVATEPEPPREIIFPTRLVIRGSTTVVSARPNTSPANTTISPIHGQSPKAGGNRDLSG